MKFTKSLMFLAIAFAAFFVTVGNASATHYNNVVAINNGYSNFSKVYSYAYPVVPLVKVQAVPVFPAYQAASAIIPAPIQYQAECQQVVTPVCNVTANSYSNAYNNVAAVNYNVPVALIAVNNHAYGYSNNVVVNKFLASHNRNNVVVVNRRNNRNVVVVNRRNNRNVVVAVNNNRNRVVVVNNGRNRVVVRRGLLGQRVIIRR